MANEKVPTSAGAQAETPRLALEKVTAPESVLAGSLFRVRVRLTNRGNTDLAGQEHNPIRLAYHCYSEEMAVVVFEGRRTSLSTLNSGAVAEVEMSLEAPQTEGRFLFRLTLVQEGVRWFDTEPQNLWLDAWIRVANPHPAYAPAECDDSVETQPLRSRRLLLTSTPRSGNTWLRLLLHTALGILEADVHEPSALDWDHLPDGFVVQLHCHRTAGMLQLLDRLKIQPVAIIRHPLDVLISILHFCTFERQTALWLGGEGGNEASIIGRSPTDPEFLEYSLSARAEALLSVSPEWLWAGCPVVRYETLVARPAAALQALLGGQALAVPVETAVDKCRIEKLRGSAGNNHFWRGQPGLWRSLISEEWARRIYSRHRQVFEALGYDVEGAAQLHAAGIQQTWLQF